MINMEKLVEDARLARLEAEVTQYHSLVARRHGNVWRAEMLEMDAKFAAEEAAVLLGKILLIAMRVEEIAEFERTSGAPFDARDMDVPRKRVVTRLFRCAGNDNNVSQEN